MQSVRTCGGEGGTPNNQLAAFWGVFTLLKTQQMQTPGFQSPPHPQRWESFWLTDCTFSYFRVQAHTNTPFPEAVETAPLALPLRKVVRD